MATITDIKHLSNFVESINGWWNKGPKKYDIKNLSQAQIAELIVKVETALSPENLTCDGELTGNTLKLKTEYLNGAKRQLLKVSK